MPVEMFIIVVVVGAAPLVAWGRKGHRTAWLLLAVLLLWAGVAAVVLCSAGQLTVQWGLDHILRLLGAILLVPGVLILVRTGHEHHSRSGKPSLTFTFEPMAPDLMRKANYGFLFIVLGAILLLLGWLLPKIL